MVMAVVEKLDLTRFHEPIKARAGQAGRDATDPQLLVALWLYGCTRGIGSARELARRCEDSAAFRWLCGGVSVNHRMLSEFRTGHSTALDALFTQVIASLVDKDVVHVSRVSQDGVRVRVGAGASSFRRQQRLGQLLEQARQHVEQLRNQVDSPEHAALSARQRAARKRAVVEKLERLEQAIAQLPELKRKQAEAARQAGHGKRGEQIRKRQPRDRGRGGEQRRQR
jgi:transposase